MSTIPAIQSDELSEKSQELRIHMLETKVLNLVEQLASAKTELALREGQLTAAIGSKKPLEWGFIVQSQSGFPDSIHSTREGAERHLERLSAVLGKDSHKIVGHDGISGVSSGCTAVIY